MYRESFPSKLKQARETSGYTQQQVADLLDIKQYQISCYENGKTQPDIETLGKMADFYCVSVDWLMGTNGGKK
mgnify:FL=1